MKTLKQFAVVLLAVLMSASVNVSAQTPGQQVPLQVVWQYNLNQTVTPIYCGFVGPVSTSDRVTASASTTLTAVSGTPFLNVGVGDMLVINELNGPTYQRTVTVRNSSTSVVISGAAVTIVSGLITTQSQDLSCSTSSDTAGVFQTNFFKTAIQINIAQQVNTGGISFHLQCRLSPNDQWVQAQPDLTLPTMTLSYTAAITGVGQFIWETESIFSQCRVGMFIVTADDGNDLTTNAEQVSIKILGRQ